MPGNLFPVSVFLLLLGTAAIVLRRFQKVYALPLPPGPPTSWLGRVALPKTYQWRTYAKWKALYGDIIYIYILGNPIIVLNSAEAINELLEKRSGKYSSRPVRTMVNELMGWDWLFSSMQYGSWWRRHRSLFHQYFHPNAFSVYQPTQLKEARALLRSLLRKPENFSHHIRRTGAAVVLSISYGYEVAEENDSYVELADKAISALGNAGVFGTYLVDYIPLLKHVPTWFPGARFQRDAQKWRKHTRDMVNLPFQMVKDSMAQGSAPTCFVTDALGSQSADTIDEELIKDVAAIIYGAGADTTVSTIQSFFLAITLHPEIQKKAQDELDLVVGNDRLPAFSDKDSLPFINCIVWECLRWNPVTPMGLAHYVTENDEYKGYRIPKNTTILPNVWAVLHDPIAYPDPLTFDPERFSDQEKNALAGINDLPLAAFGFGRRMCPGRWLALDTIWVAIASVLSVYNISKTIDENGMPIEPDTEYTSSLLSRPKPFKCSIVPRSQAAVDLIQQTD